MRHRAFILAALLMMLPSALIAYRIFFLGYPFLPAAAGKAWQVSMDALVRGEGDEVKVIIGLPHAGRDRAVFEEKISGGELDVSLLHEGLNRFGVWSGTTDTKGENISYRATIILRPEQKIKEEQPAAVPYPQPLGQTGQEMVERLALNWRNLGLKERFHAVVSALSGNWGTVPPASEDILAWRRLREEQGHPAALMALLSAAGLPARISEGLALTESVTPMHVIWTEVWTGNAWAWLDPETGAVYRKSALLLPLTTGGIPAVRVLYGELTDMRWTLKKQIISQWRLQFERMRQSERFLDRWSLFRLPEEFQGTFRILLLVPVGALVVCVLRNMVGFPTFGIFMPVLMALAFRNTGLAYGLGIFGGVVFVGYGVRRFLDRLHLLLVPRLSVILTLVIGCFTVFAVAGNKLGMREFMAVGLLPFVILTMTIERFFVIMEEEGLQEGLRTALGSATVAAITFGIIHIEPLQLSFFMYPELLFMVAALQVLIGRYTGYRLSEFLRFRSLRGSS